MPDKGYELHWCPKTPGFGVRITSNGARAWIAERRLDGKTVRRTLGKASGPASISGEAARRLQVDVSSELQQGVDRAVERRQERRAIKDEAAADALTLDTSLRSYVEKKRRGKDGLPLKDRTKADYLAMIEPGGTTKTGRPKVDGELFVLAQKPLAKITADDMRKLHASLQDRGERRAVYAMQVLRAVLNWHGIKIPGNPLSRDVAGRDRIVLRQAAGKPNPIPPERLGAWWRAACKAGSEEIGGSAVAGDYYRFRLLTGTRGVEVLGDDFGNPPIRVRDLDAAAGRIVLPDTKNRSSHVLLLSKQALAIASRNAEGKKPKDALFPVMDPRKTLQAINRAAGVAVAGHELRDTFASVAEELVSAYTVKRMVNHADVGDVTGASYIGKSEAQLRAGWQAVADFVEQTSVVEG
ncbi:uncharacterized protein DUF4102 [Rivibacter subsaxonicus]|uniref:Uncharacterized protein DUF4102 n=2 Tax=Rivibacter subsaxonicus TaxID=457575 RepID=A0A4Q7VEW8_9BURK|nr:uncharacterized protein DUF4102 [Rivibacter subsaxonicus]